MLKLAGVLVMSLFSAAAASAQPAPACLHGSDESAAQKVRRDAAIQLATRINLAESTIIGPMPRRYRPLEELSVPAPPAGFDLQFHTDGRTYSFSLKDRLDPCKYVVFSDQDGMLYEAVARRGPATIVPLNQGATVR
jgi:hypothetical protein